MLFAVGGSLLLERIDGVAVVVVGVDGVVIAVVVVVVAVVAVVVEDDGFVIVHCLWWIC